MARKRKRLNRIKEVIIESGHSSIWLARKLKVNPVSVSKWSSNTMQPTLENLFRIADALEVEVRSLIVSTKGE
jgi:putative transcriptional regulator